VRYNSKSDGGVYTVTGHILIAVNPFRDLTIYNEKTIKQYLGRPIGSEPPHIYAVAPGHWAAQPLQGTRGPTRSGDGNAEYIVAGSSDRHKEHGKTGKDNAKPDSGGRSPSPKPKLTQDLNGAFGPVLPIPSPSNSSRPSPRASRSPKHSRSPKTSPRARRSRSRSPSSSKVNSTHSTPSHSPRSNVTDNSHEQQKESSKARNKQTPAKSGTDYDVEDLFVGRASQKRGSGSDDKAEKRDSCSDVSTGVGTRTTVSRDVASSLVSPSPSPPPQAPPPLPPPLQPPSLTVPTSALAEAADANLELDSALSSAGQLRLAATLQRLDRRSA